MICMVSNLINKSLFFVNLKVVKLSYQTRQLFTLVLMSVSMLKNKILQVPIVFNAYNTKNGDTGQTHTYSYTYI